jgi:hypothetical protein
VCLATANSGLDVDTRIVILTSVGMFGNIASDTIDIIANNPIDQKVVDLSSSQHYSLVENAIYRSVFPPQGV